MKRTLNAIVLLALMASLAALPAAAQVAVSVQNPQFSWTGKSGQQINYRWSATVDNPARKSYRVRVTLELIDGGGNVVGSDSTEITATEEDQTDIEETGSIAFSTAQQARQYRVVIIRIDS